MNRLQGPERLSANHDVAHFDCGKEPLNTFLVRHALANQANNSAQTYVALNGNRVIGYYSLAASAVLQDDAPTRMAKGLARHSIPVVLMARFAVDRSYQGQGLGSALFKDAIKRTLNVSTELGVRAFIVHAKDDEARALYEHYGMEPFPSNPYHLFLLMKDIKSALGLG